MTRARDENAVRLRREAMDPPMLLVELAREADCSPGLISQIEGGFVPKLRTMVKIAAALGVSPVDLWPDEVEEIGL